MSDAEKFQFHVTIKGRTVTLKDEEVCQVKITFDIRTSAIVFEYCGEYGAVKLVDATEGTLTDLRMHAAIEGNRFLIASVFAE